MHSKYLKQQMKINERWKCYQKVSEAGLWLTHISDHLSIYIIAPISPDKIEVATTFVKKRFYSTSDMNKFENLLANTNWTPVYEAIDADKQFSTFERIVHELHEQCFPVLHLLNKCENKSKVWL